MQFGDKCVCSTTLLLVFLVSVSSAYPYDADNGEVSSYHQQQSATVRDKRTLGFFLKSFADVIGYDVQKRPSILEAGPGIYLQAIPPIGSVSPAKAVAPAMAPAVPAPAMMPAPATPEKAPAPPAMMPAPAAPAMMPAPAAPEMAPVPAAPAMAPAPAAPGKAPAAQAPAMPAAAPAPAAPAMVPARKAPAAPAPSMPAAAPVPAAPAAPMPMAPAAPAANPQPKAAPQLTETIRKMFNLNFNWNRNLQPQRTVPDTSAAPAPAPKPGNAPAPAGGAPAPAPAAAPAPASPASAPAAPDTPAPAPAPAAKDPAPNPMVSAPAPAPIPAAPAAAPAPAAPAPVPAAPAPGPAPAAPAPAPAAPAPKYYQGPSNVDIQPNGYQELDNFNQPPQVIYYPNNDAALNEANARESLENEYSLPEAVQLFWQHSPWNRANLHPVQNAVPQYQQYSTPDGERGYHVRRIQQNVHLQHQDLQPEDNDAESQSEESQNNAEDRKDELRNTEENDDDANSDSSKAFITYNNQPRGFQPTYAESQNNFHQGGFYPGLPLAVHGINEDKVLVAWPSPFELAGSEKKLKTVNPHDRISGAGSESLEFRYEPENYGEYNFFTIPPPSKNEYQFKGSRYPNVEGTLSANAKISENIGKKYTTVHIDRRTFHH